MMASVTTGTNRAVYENIRLALNMFSVFWLKKGFRETKAVENIGDQSTVDVLSTSECRAVVWFNVPNRSRLSDLFRPCWF